MTPPLSTTHPGIFGVAEDPSRTPSLMSAVYEVLEDPPTHHRKSGWLSESSPLIAGPYAASQGPPSSAPADLCRGSAPREEKAAPIGQKPKRRLNRGRVNSALYLHSPGSPTSSTHTVESGDGRGSLARGIDGLDDCLSQLPVALPPHDSLGLDDRLSQMQEVIAQLQAPRSASDLARKGASLSSTGRRDEAQLDRPLFTPSCLAPGPDVRVGVAVEQQASDEGQGCANEEQGLVEVLAMDRSKPKDDDAVIAEPKRRARAQTQAQFLFTPGDLENAQERGVNLQASSHFTAKQMETAHRRGLKLGSETRDIVAEMSDLVAELSELR